MDQTHVRTVCFSWDKEVNFLILYSANETIDMSNSTKKEHAETAIGIIECYYDISDGDSCEEKVVQPATYWAKVGIHYSRAWYKKIYNKYFPKMKEWKKEANYFLEEFSHKNLTSEADYFAVAKKFISQWKDIFSGSSSMLGGFDISSAGLSFASGVFTSVKPNVTEMLVSFLLIFLNTANVDSIFSFKQEFSHPQSIKAQNIKDAFRNTFSLLKKASVTGFKASAVNFFWTLDDVFIAKASNEINGQKPADLDLSILEKNARTCDDQGTCYFFIVSQNASNIATGKWKGAKGISKIEQYNVTLLELAQSAAWFQKEFKGYAAQPNSSALLESVQSNQTRPSLSYFVNLPVVDLDNAKAAHSKNSSEVALLKTVTREISTLKGWPYPKSTK